MSVVKDVTKGLNFKALFWREKRKTAENYIAEMKHKRASAERKYKKDLKKLTEQIETYTKRINAIESRVQNLLDSMENKRRRNY